MPVLDRFVSVFGARIHYVEAGDGPVVLLLHGLADDTSVWESTLSALAPKYRVIALDQIGFGRSDKPLLNYRIGTFVDFLAGFCKELGIEHAILVGNSLGGWVGAAFVLAHPEKADRLVLVDAAGLGGLVESLGPRVMSALHLATRDDVRLLGPLTFYHPHFYSDNAALDAGLAQRVTAGDSYTIARVLDSMERREDLLDGKLASIRQPTLILWGREDRLIPLAFGERFHREISGSQAAIIERCGHMPQVECPVEFNKALLKFLAETDPAGK
jgi:2-hydroxy-6-oxonona-2,4-dienedioate hydrolase